MDGEDDHGWDGPNIRPPQASFSDDKYQRQRNPNVRKDRQVFVSKRDEPSKGHDYKRQPHDDRRHRGEDLRTRLNRGTGGTKASHRHTTGDRDRNIRDGKRESHAPRRQHQASTHSKPPPQRSRDRQDNKRSGRQSEGERGANLQRIMNAQRSSEESKKDAELRRERKLLEKATQEAERNIFRKRDRSRDRQDDTKRSKGEEAKDKSEEESEAESGEEEESDETESGEESTDSDGTDQESVASTPDRNGTDDGGDREEEEGDEDQEENDNQGSIELSPGRSSKKYDSDRSPSKSPTPRRDSGDEAGEPENDIAPQDKTNEMEAEREPEQPEHDFRDDLPPYLPSIYGCRSVEEFHCLNKIEEGTYGVVFRARDKKTNEIVALKRLKMEREKEGFPITSLREINTLLISQHQNVVHVREIVVGSNMNRIFIVMDFVEHDMKALMETMRHKKQHFLPGEVKCLMQQLLSAIAHLHDNWILHRDLKTSNLLLSHNGVLKVGDFGLAREYGSPLKDYTAVVVTLWYRAPELLLGKKDYSTPIDVWSIGCIFAEFLLMEPLLPGKSEIEQLNKIFSLLGTPNDKIWPEFKSLPLAKNLGKFVEKPHSQLRNKFQKVELSEKGLDLLKSLLIYDPNSRISCDKAFNHPYFAETPLAIHHSMFPTWPAKSELGASAVKKASSPKPPSGGGAFKKLEDDEDERGFSLKGAQAPAVWSLKF